MTLRYWPLVVVLLVPAVAHAAPVWFTGMDVCQVHSVGKLWAAMPGWTTSGISISSTVKDSTPGNRCSVRIQAPSGQIRALQTSSVSFPYFAHVNLRVAAPPASKRKIVTLRGSTQDACIMAIEPVAQECKGGSNAGKSCTKAADCPGGSCPALAYFKLTTYYNDIDITGGECSASQMDYTECGGACSVNADCLTTTREDVKCEGGFCINECAEAIVGEATCAPGIMAVSPRMAINQWHRVALGQVISGGNVTCSLWTGKGGATPKAYPRGGQTRPQGKCFDGTKEDYACAVNDDCPGSSCLLNSISPQTVIFGFSGNETTGGTGADIYMDDFYADSTTANPNWRIEPIAPNANGTITTNWTKKSGGDAHGCGTGSDLWQCLNDYPSPSATPDGSESAVEKVGGGAPPYPHDVALAMLPTPMPTPLAVGLFAVAQNWSNDGDFRLDMWAPSPVATAIPGAVFDLGGFKKCNGGANVGAGCSVNSECPSSTCVADDGPSAGYYAVPLMMSATKPGGGAWDFTSLDSLQLRFSKTDSTNAQMRTTAVLAEVLLDLPDPPVPSNLTDKTGDGLKTVCAIGGSGYNDDYFHQVLSGILEPNNVIECAKGGYTVGDVVGELHKQGSNNDILDGYGTSFNTCTALKGAKAPCDYVMVEIGVNSMHAGTAYAAPSNRDRVCVGGTNDGGVCDVDSACPSSGTCEPGEYGLLQHGYCDDNGGANQGAPCYCQRHSQWYSDIAAKECVGGANTGTRCANSSECPSGSCDTAWFRYCRVRGSDWKTTCIAESDCACSTNADCKLVTGDTAGVCRVCAGGANENFPCTTDTQCPSSTCSYICAKLGRYQSRDDDIRVTSMRLACTGGSNNGLSCGADSDCPSAKCVNMPVTWCTGGCLNAPGCSSGVCVAGNQEAYMREQYKRIVSIIQARKYCMAGSNPGTQCASNGDCTGGGTCTGSPVPVMGTVSPGHIKGGKLNWQAIEKKAGAFRAWMLPYLRSASVNYVDTWSYLWQYCEDLFTRDGGFLGAAADCLRDPIHWTEYGQDIVAGAIGDCIDQSPCTGGLCEGVCQGGVNVGLSCFTDAGCPGSTCANYTCSGGFRDGLACTIQSADGVCNTTPTCSASACSAGAQSWCAVDADCAYCTSGRVNDKCATNADCDLYSCTL